MAEIDAGRILDLLNYHYPEAGTSLKCRNPFEFLVAVILSARSTDEQVNRVTAPLFERYPDAFALAEASPEEVARVIRGCGLYRSKAGNLVKMSQLLVRKHGGRVPDTWEDIISLPGVGRKTAALVVSTWFGQPAFPVDTHVFRVSRRLGLARGEKVEEVEKELKAGIDKGRWFSLHHQLIAHGRSVCLSGKPKCDLCFLQEVCSYSGGKELNSGGTGEVDTPYTGLAGVYDYLMQSVDYEGWCCYVEKIVSRHGIAPERVLDLACGNGNSTFPFARRGYRVTGVDSSGEMIEQARRKSKELSLEMEFVAGDLRDLDLQGKFDLAVLYQDGINYLLTEEELGRAFSGVYRHLDEGGYLVFDLNFPGFYHGEGRESCRVDEEDFILEWESSYRPELRIREILLLVYLRKEDGSFESYREVHTEKEHTREEIIRNLERIGFVLEEVYPTFGFEVPQGSDPRLTFVARKEGGK